MAMVLMMLTPLTPPSAQLCCERRGASTTKTPTAFALTAGTALARNAPVGSHDTAGRATTLAFGETEVTESVRRIGPLLFTPATRTKNKSHSSARVSKETSPTLLGAATLIKQVGHQ